MPKNAVRVLLATLLLAVAGFCAFGFLATFEFEFGQVVVWRVMYGMVGVGAFLTALRLAWLAAPLLRSK